MTNLINNPLIYLFETMETQSGYTFAEFVTQEEPDNTFKDQPYMQQYSANSTKGTVYKYLYDPNLEFGFRFHQRIARIKYTDRKEPWITVMFNTGVKAPLTNIISHRYVHRELATDGFHSIDVRKNRIPISMVFVSNSLDHLYSFLGRLNFWFDRFVGFHYKQSIQYSNSLTENYDLAAQADNIRPVDLTKLDTERRGSLATAGFTFDMNYWELSTPEEGYLLKHIDIIIRTVSNQCDLDLNYQVV